MAGDQTFENLSHSKLLSAPSKDSKEVSFQIDVWGGNTSFVVFTGGGGKPWKITVPLKVRHLMVLLLRKMIAEPSVRREAVMINAWDAEAKKWNNVGCIGFGIDEKNNFYVDLAHNELNGRHQFLIRTDAKFDFLQTAITERDQLQSVINFFIDIMINQTTNAERLTSFRRAPGGGGGGNRGGYGGGGGGNRGGGYGGNNNGGNNSYGGGGSGGRSGGTFSDGGDSGDQLHV